MRKLAILIAIVLLVVLTTPTGVLADLPSGAITVSVTGNGTWSDGVLSLSLFPGESKCFEVTVHNNWDSELFLEAQTAPNCVSGCDIVACFYPNETTLGVNATCIFNLTVAASGSAPPSSLEPGGVFSANLTISASVGNETEPEPETGVPHHVSLTSAQSGLVVGSPYDLTATVYDSADTPLPNISVGWSVLSGTATLSSLGFTTDISGQAHATADCVAVGTSKVRCKVENKDVSGTIDLTWVEDDDGGDGNGNGDGNGVVTTPNIRQPVSGVAFGEVLIDDTLDKTLVVYNDGDAPLVISSIVRSSGSEDFAYASPLVPFTIGSEDSTVITVRFTPTVVGEESATFTVTSNDPDTPGVSFAVSGTGRSRGQPAWKVFLIGILIIGSGFGGYIYYKRWREKKSSLDMLAGSGDLDLESAGDELNLD